jgi:hypothetical protein
VSLDLQRSKERAVLQMSRKMAEEGTCGDRLPQTTTHSTSFRAGNCLLVGSQRNLELKQMPRSPYLQVSMTAQFDYLDAESRELVGQIVDGRSDHEPRSTRKVLQLGIVNPEP